MPLDAAICREVEHKLEQIIDPETDSLRFYYLGNNYKHVRAKPSFDVTEPLII